MDKSLSLSQARHEPWFWSLLCVILIPAFPEYYGAPLLSVVAFFLAKKATKTPFHRTTVPLTGQFILLYLLWMTVGLLYSRSRGSVAVTLLVWGLMFLCYRTVTVLITSRKRLNTALYLTACVAGGVGAIAIVQHLLKAYTRLPVRMQFYAFLDGFLKQITGLPFNLADHGSRASATFANPNILAEYLVMVMPFLLYYSLKAPDETQKKRTRLCLVLALFGLFFTYSRGCYIAIILVFLTYIIYYRKAYQTLLFLCVAALMVVPYSVTSRLFSLSKAHNIVSGIMENDDFSYEDGISDDLPPAIRDDPSNNTYVERLDVLTVGFYVFSEHPLTGIGAGMFATWDEFKAHNINVPHTHNLILQLLMEGGLPAFLLMLGAGISLLAKGFTLLRHSQNPLCGLTLVAFFIGFVSSGMFDFPLLSPKLIGSFLSVLALSDAAFTLEYPHRHYTLRCFRLGKRWNAALASGGKDSAHSA